MCGNVTFRKYSWNGCRIGSTQNTIVSYDLYVHIETCFIQGRNPFWSKDSLLCAVQRNGYDNVWANVSLSYE